MPSVLDASALLVYLLGEPGSPRVTALLAQGCSISAANWAETLSKLADLGQPPASVVRDLTEQGVLGTALLIVPLDAAQAQAIAALRASTKPLGLSLGDRACLALARELGQPAVTADRAWAALQVGVPIQVIR